MRPPVFQKDEQPGDAFGIADRARGNKTVNLTHRHPEQSYTLAILSLKWAGNKVGRQIEVQVFAGVAGGGVEATQPLNTPGEKARLLAQLTADCVLRLFARFNAASGYLQ